MTVQTTPPEIDRLVFLDTETTGLDERTGCMLEIAYAVTTLDLVRHSHDSYRIWPLPQAVWETTPDIYAMHERSGLLAEIDREGEQVQDVERQVIDALVEAGCKPKQTTLAGFTVSFDWRWLRHHMPNLCNFFHYRLLDFSSIYVAQSLWGVKFPKPVSRHRARPDVEDALECARRMSDIYRATRHIHEACTMPWLAVGEAGEA